MAKKEAPKSGNVPQHKALAMGKPVTGMKKGGKSKSC